MPRRMGLGIKPVAFQFKKTKQKIKTDLENSIYNTAGPFSLKASSSSPHKVTSASLPPSPYPTAPTEKESKQELKAQGSCFRVGRALSRWEWASVASPPETLNHIVAIGTRPGEPPRSFSLSSRLP